MLVDSWYFHCIKGKTSVNATLQQPTLFAAVSCFASHRHTYHVQYWQWAPCHLYGAADRSHKQEHAMWADLPIGYLSSWYTPRLLTVCFRSPTQQFMWWHQSWHGHPALWIRSYTPAVTASTEPHTADFCAVCTLKNIEIWFIKRRPRAGEVALHIHIQVQGRPSLQKCSNTMQPWTKSVLGRPMALNEVTLEVCSECNGIYDWISIPAILLSKGHLLLKFMTANWSKAITQLQINLDTLWDQ